MLIGSIQGNAISSLLPLKNGPAEVFPEASGHVIVIMAVGLLGLAMFILASHLILRQGGCTIPLICIGKSGLSEVRYPAHVTKLLSGRAVQCRQLRLEARLSPSRHSRHLGQVIAVETALCAVGC